MFVVKKTCRQDTVFNIHRYTSEI